MKPQIIVSILLAFFANGCRQPKSKILQQASTFIQQGNYNRAIELCSKILKEDSTVQLAYFTRGISYSNKGEYAKAIHDFDKIILLQPHSTGIYFQPSQNSQFASEEDKLKVTAEEALYQRAMTEYIMGNFQSSLQDFNACLANGYDLPANSYVLLGNVYIKNGDKEKACEMYLKAFLFGDSVAPKLREINCK